MELKHKEAKYLSKVIQQLSGGPGSRNNVFSDFRNVIRISNFKLVDLVANKYGAPSSTLSSNLTLNLNILTGVEMLVGSLSPVS